VLFGEAGHLVIVDPLCLGAHTIGFDVIHLPRKVQRVSVGQVPTMSEAMY
jgi:hypothetical protein